MPDELTPPVIPPDPALPADEFYGVVEDREGHTVQFEELPLNQQPSAEESNVAAYYISIAANPEGIAPGSDVENYENAQQWLRDHPLEWRVQVVQD